MTNPIHDRIGGKYYKPGSARYWFYGFITVIALLWFLAIMNNSNSEPIYYLTFISVCASSVVVGVVAMFAAPFSAQVVAQMRKHEAYELIQITTLTRQQMLLGFLSGMFARFREGVGFPLPILTALSIAGVLVIFPVSELAWVMLMPVPGMLGLCYLGLVAGIASGLMLKSTIGANILALVSHFVVVTLWFLFAYTVEIAAAFNYLDGFPGATYNRRNLMLLVAGTTIAPYVLAIIPLTLSYIFVRRR